MLSVEKKDEITITVPASIRIRSAYGENKKHEYDGIIIFPNRKEKQIVFLEAKNGRRNNGQAEKCLSDKLNDSNIFYLEEDIKKLVEMHICIILCQLRWNKILLFNCTLDMLYEIW